MLGAEGQHNGVVRGRRLQFEIKGTAESFAQGQPPRAVHPRAKRRMHDQLHPAGFVKEPLQHDFLLRWNDSQRLVTGAKIFRQLPRARFRKRQFFGKPVHQFLRSIAGILNDALHFVAKRRDGAGQLSGASGAFPQPKRHAGRLSLRIRHAHRPRDNLQNLP